MGRKRKELPILKNIEISGVAAEGKALAKVAWNENDENRIVVFVPFAAPGDIADIKIRIPMAGSIESLNAAVAAGILMYQSRIIK